MVYGALVHIPLYHTVSTDTKHPYISTHTHIGTSWLLNIYPLISPPTYSQDFVNYSYWIILSLWNRCDKLRGIMQRIYCTVILFQLLRLDFFEPEVLLTYLSPFFSVLPGKITEYYLFVVVKQWFNLVCLWSVIDLTGSADGCVRLWEWGHGQPVATLRQPGTFPKVTKVLFNAQGNKVFSY